MWSADVTYAPLERYEAPEIFNSDLGSQLTGLEFTEALKEVGIRISMDGKGRWTNNIFIERLWGSRLNSHSRQATL